MVLVFAVPVAVFWPGLFGDFFFDSLPNIAQNPAVQLAELTPASLLVAATSYAPGPLGRPVPMLSFALNWYLAGPDPFWFKLVNLLLHAGNALLVYALALRLLRLRAELDAYGEGVDAGGLVLASLLTGLLWGLAPVHGFTVPYAVQRMVLLGALFALLALHAYLSARTAAGARQAGGVLRYSALTVLAAGLSLASKETAVLIPFFIAVIEFFLLRWRGLGRWRTAFRVGVWLAVLLPALAMALSVWQSPQGIHRGYELRVFTPVERMLTQARVLVTYLRNTLLPDYGQIHFFNDNLPISHSLFDPVTTGFALGFWGLLAIAGFLWRNRLPLCGFAIFWFMAGHALESSFWSLELVFWHRNYLPALGPLMALAVGLVWLARRPGRLRWLGVGLTMLALAGSGFQTWLIARDWSDRAAIARAEVIKNPGSSRANHYYARIATIIGEETANSALLAEGRKFFTRAMELDSNTLHPVHGLLYLALAHDQGEVRPLIEELQRRCGSRLLEVSESSVFTKLVNAVFEYHDRLEPAEVLKVFDAVVANPRAIADQKASALENEAELLARAGKPPAAYLPPLRRALSYSPDSLIYRSLLFRTLIDAGELDEAAAMLATPFTDRDRRREPSLAAYELRLRYLLEARRSVTPGPALPPMPPGS